MQQLAQPDPTSPYLSIREAAAYVRVSPDTVRRLIRTGKLPARRVGGQWRIRRSDLDGASSEECRTA